LDYSYTKQANTKTNNLFSVKSLTKKMKIGKTIIQIYAGLSMILQALSLLVLAGIGTIGMNMGLSDAANGFIGLGIGIVVAMLIIELYIYWNLFKFKDWARKIWLVFSAINLFIAFNLFSLIVYGFLGWLMFIDKDTEKAFK